MLLGEGCGAKGTEVCSGCEETTWQQTRRRKSQSNVHLLLFLRAVGWEQRSTSCRSVCVLCGFVEEFDVLQGFEICLSALDSNVLLLGCVWGSSEGGGKDFVMWSCWKGSGGGHKDALRAGGVQPEDSSGDTSLCPSST